MSKAQAGLATIATLSCAYGRVWRSRADLRVLLEPDPKTGTRQLPQRNRACQTDLQRLVLAYIRAGLEDAHPHSYS